MQALFSENGECIINMRKEHRRRSSRRRSRSRERTKKFKGRGTPNSLGLRAWSSEEFPQKAQEPSKLSKDWVSDELQNLKTGKWTHDKFHAVNSSLLSEEGLVRESPKYD